MHIVNTYKRSTYVNDGLIISGLPNQFIILCTAVCNTKWEQKGLSLLFLVFYVIIIYIFIYIYVLVWYLVVKDWIR